MGNAACGDSSACSSSGCTKAHLAPCSFQNRKEAEDAPQDVIDLRHKESPSGTLPIEDHGRLLTRESDGAATPVKTISVKVNLHKPEQGRFAQRIKLPSTDFLMLDERAEVPEVAKHLLAK
eukprot:gnl/MRDRNA2_/MRDRNA2_290064_c0_seq1.p1 gnl/MRDRNA2_/MRDRNA2_290064_c0~~gnl/MRDRNA2_/MRDRNA2_290064_c0_seq1.p1  ORF type:complete len:121 (-),score=31.02 gnl/MRDRNA2_/MRDRNA2_290064_c0_seq1:161-523(-)